MIERIHAAEHGDRQIRTADETMYRFAASDTDSFLSRYAQITATTPEYHHSPTYDLREDGEPIADLVFSGLQPNDENLLALDISGNGVEKARRTTLGVSTDAREGKPTGRGDTAPGAPSTVGASRDTDDRPMTGPPGRALTR